MYKRWYAALIRLYPKPFRERFGEGMQQTFSDLCREHPPAFILWVFAETGAQILNQHIRFHLMYSKSILRPALVTGVLLLVPLIAMRFTSEVQWTGSDFVFMGMLLFLTGLAFELISRKSGQLAYRAAVALAVLASFLLVWVNAAVGIIGDENPANVLYLAVIAFGFFGALAMKFEARASARVMFVTAAAQFLVPVIAVIFWPADFSPGVFQVFVLNSFFVMMWLASGMLLRNASK